MNGAGALEWVAALVFVVLVLVEAPSGCGVTRLLLRRVLRRIPPHLRGRAPLDCGEGVDRPDFLVGYGPRIRPATLTLTLEESLWEKRERRLDEWRAQGEGYRPMAVADGARLVPPSGGTGVRRREEAVSLDDDRPLGRYATRMLR